jgi:hypothetical protein
VVCARSTLLQLHLVSDRRQGVSVQRFAQGGVRADVEAGQALVAGRIIEHGHRAPARSIILSGVRSMGSNVLKYTRGQRAGARHSSPLIPCFIGGNSHPTIPYRFKDDQRIGHGSADTHPGPPPDGVYRRGGEDQGRAAQREQDQGGRDEEASQRGRCRSGGGARRRRSGLNTGL